MPVSDLQQIPFIDLGAQRDRLRSRLDAALGRVLDHGRFISGPEVGRLEQQLQDYCGVENAVSCANGTDALELALTALGLQAGDEVVVPAFTFSATAEAVARLGGIPRFADVEADSFNLAPRSVRDAFESSDGRAVGLIVVDLFGQPADYAELSPLAEQYGAWVIDDAAQSFGATANGVPVGQLAPITTTSFFPAKPLGCYGDGGAVLTDSAETAGLLRSLREHGEGVDKYDNVRIGQNSRLDSLQAAVLLEKLTIFDSELAERQRVADRYSAGLRDLVTVPPLSSGNSSVWAQYTVRVEPEARDSVRSRLQEAAVPTAVYYPTPLHQQPAYRHFPRAESGLETSERLARSVLSLPMHAYLTEQVQERIVGGLRTALQ